MFFQCDFDEKLDIGRVEPFLALNIEEAIRSGIVPDTGDVPIYNDIDDPSAIAGRMADPIGAVDLQKAHLDRAAAASKAAKESAAAAAAAAAQSTAGTNSAGE